MEAVLCLAGFVILIYAAITYATYTNMLQMAKMTLTPSPVVPPPQESDEWAAKSEFNFIQHYTTKVGAMTCMISAWQRPDRPTFFCRYAIQLKGRLKVSYDLVTSFANHIGLTTGDTKDGNFFPSFPGAYKQSFSNMSFDQRWDMHIEMENYLMDEGKVELLKQDRPFEQFFTESIKKQIGFIKSIPFWPFRGAYWYFIRRNIWHNKSIRTQREKGMIKLPNEVSQTEILMPPGKSG